MKIYVTGFEPFGKRNINTSLIVSRLVDSNKNFMLKVGWEYIDEELDRILDENPDYLILMGEAASYKNIVIETKAHNIADGIDNYNVKKINEKISDYNDVLETRLNIDFKDIDYNIGNDAGKYLCNYSYYKALEKTLNRKTIVVFIHYPLIKEEGGSLSLIDLVIRTNKIIEALRENQN